MTRMRAVFLLLLLGTACSTRFAQTAEEGEASGGAGTPASGGAGTPASGGASGTPGTGGTAGMGGSTGGVPAACPEGLAARLTITEVQVDEDIRYKRPSYDNFPADERVALSVGPDGAAQVAWIDDTLSRVHVTPLTQTGGRADLDVVVRGNDLSGLVARSDGFALLTRRDDPGEPLQDPAASNVIAKAAVLVRVRNRVEVFAAPLTGTAQVNSALPADQKRDCAGSPLAGRLAFNGQRYGAYFVVHGCAGHPNASFYADKLAYVDDRGNFSPGGWNWNCSLNEGLRLLPEAGAFTSLCISEGLPFRGLNLVVEGRPAQLLSAEFSVSPGYSAAQFGSVVRMGDGSYVVGWLSRGLGATLRPATDIAFMRLSRDYTPLTPPTWLQETPVTVETNLHLAAYGPDRLLVAWDSMDGNICDDHTCFGTYTGTHLRLIDMAGNFLTPDEVTSAAPNSEDDITPFPNGDLGWAYVPEEARNYDGPLLYDNTGAPLVRSKRQLRVARLRYCP